MSRVETFPPATLVYFCMRKSIEFSTTAWKVHVMLSVMSFADNDCCSTVADGNASIHDIISHVTHDCTTCKIQETLGDGNISIHDFLKKYDASIYICYKSIELKNSNLAWKPEYLQIDMSKVTDRNIIICDFCDFLVQKVICYVTYHKSCRWKHFHPWLMWLISSENDLLCYMSCKLQMKMFLSVTFDISMCKYSGFHANLLFFNSIDL